MGDSRKRGRKMKMDFRRKQIERQKELLRMDRNAPGFDRDIWLLKWELTEIQPGSLSWRMGLIRALRRAIRALERENKERGDK